jgi:phage repressor protein C with HTH and peptisase S24 domain
MSIMENDSRHNLPNVKMLVGDVFVSSPYFPQMTLSDRIRTARKGAKLTQQQVADHFGIARVSVTQWESGDGRSRPDSKKLPELASLLQTTTDWLLSDDPAAPASTAAAVQEVYPVGETEPIMRRLGPHTLPVLGITLGGDTDDDNDRPADFWMNGEVVNYIARPRSLENAKDAFALYVDGTSMFPRFREKDLVVVQKVTPASGDDVVIELKPKREADEGSNASFLKEFVRRAGGSIVVKQYNPEKEITFDLKEIKNLFRVIPMRELMA